MSVHTPGPWETTEQFELDGVKSIDVQCSGNRRREFRNGGYVICRGFGDDQVANARLIAAAPEMLEALKLCAQNSECDADSAPDADNTRHTETCHHCAAMNAITKAEGKN